MDQAYVVRPYPHNLYRMREFLSKNVVAIGWPGIGDLTSAQTRDDIARAVKSKYSIASPYSLGQSAGTLFRFVHEMKTGAYVIVPDGDLVFVAKVVSGYQFDPTVDSDDQGYSHQRRVQWFFDKKAMRRSNLTGRLYDSLKGWQAVFSTYFSDLDEIIREKKHYFSQQSNIDLKNEYLARLQRGLLRGVNSNTFENAVCALFATYFPGLRRLSTTSSEVGDTDLLAELPGNVNIRIQVKHFYPELGSIEPWVVDQLALSMQPGDHGIIVTSSTISEDATQKAEALSDRTIAFIDGVQFVEYLFESVSTMPDDAVITFGLTRQLGFI